MRIDTEQVAKRLGCSQRTVREACQAGLFRTAARKNPFKDLSHWTIDSSEIEEIEFRRELQGEDELGEIG